MFGRTPVNRVWLGEHPDTPTPEALAVAKRLGLRLPLLWDSKFQFMALSKGNAQTFPVTFVIDASAQIVESLGFDQKLSAVDFLAKMRKQIDAAKVPRR